MTGSTTRHGGADPRSTYLPALLLTGLLLGGLLSGCASGFTRSTVEDFGTYRIDVTNDLAPRAQIFLVTEGEGGDGTLLGGAPVEGTTTFRIDLADPAGTYRLRAGLSRGREVVSESFVPVQISPDLPALRWILADNELSQVESVGPGEAEESGSASSAAPAGVRRSTGSRILPPNSPSSW